MRVTVPTVSAVMLMKLAVTRSPACDVQRSATLGFLSRLGTTALSAMVSEEARVVSPTWVSSSTAFRVAVALVSTMPHRLATPAGGPSSGLRPIATCSLAWISQFRPGSGICVPGAGSVGCLGAGLA